MYLRRLDELIAQNVDRISSNELGRQMGLTPSQIRQDFSCFGEFGQQGYGYRVPELRDQVARILGMNEGYSAIIIGAGNLGHALIENMQFSELGFSIAAAFDASPDKIGTSISGVEIYDSKLIADWLVRNPTDIAVLTVPPTVAENIARLVADHGVKGIWNFTNIDLDLGDIDVLIENIHFSDSLLTLSYYVKSKNDKATDI